jgi:intracellular sulfur oxidation DsrE/DsrF family protein
MEFNMQKKIPLLSLMIFFMFLPLTEVYAQWNYPVIKGYGAEVYLPNAAVQPDTNIQYKIIFSITKDKNKDEVNEGLSHLARLINVYAAAGIPPVKMKLVAVMTGFGTYAALNDKAYKDKFGKKNPNTFLLKELKEKGHVKLFVCGQAVTGLGYSESDLNQNVTLALSALTVVPTYEMKGYALMPF